MRGMSFWTRKKNIELLKQKTSIKTPCHFHYNYIYNDNPNPASH